MWPAGRMLPTPALGFTQFQFLITTPKIVAYLKVDKSGTKIIISELIYTKIKSKSLRHSELLIY